nr:MAG TPA_asm: hypothetical protein [Caudoviricetes sp.]
MARQDLSVACGDTSPNRGGFGRPGNGTRPFEHKKNAGAWALR